MPKRRLSPAPPPRRRRELRRELRTAGGNRAPTPVPATGAASPRYPSLAGYRASPRYRASRRQFLVVSAATTGMGVLHGACMGTTSSGAMEEPGYWTVRFPAPPAEREVVLVDEGSLAFSATALTWQDDTARNAEDVRTALTDRLAQVAGEHTYDELSTASGVEGLQTRMLDTLNAAYTELAGSGAGGAFETLELIISQLDPPPTP